MCFMFTEADQKTDLKSLNRKLDKKLYLVVNQQLGDAPQWIFPQGSWQTGESMRQTAERLLHATCGETLRCSFLGGVPFGFYKYKYPVESEIGKQFYGAKVCGTYFRSLTEFRGLDLIINLILVGIFLQSSTGKEFGQYNAF